MKQTGFISPHGETNYNRGQDGAGVANIKLDVSLGERYISRGFVRMMLQPIKEILQKINGRLQEVQDENQHC